MVSSYCCCYLFPLSVVRASGPTSGAKTVAGGAPVCHVQSPTCSRAALTEADAERCAEAARQGMPLSIIFDLFNLRDDLTLPDTEGHRVFVVATTLRNLALEERCGRILAAHPQVLRFALLCGHARHAVLRQLGQEMLALLRFPIEGPIERHLGRVLQDCLHSVDRTTRLRGEAEDRAGKKLPTSQSDWLVVNFPAWLLFLVYNAVPRRKMTCGKLLRSVVPVGEIVDC